MGQLPSLKMVACRLNNAIYKPCQLKRKLNWTLKFLIYPWSHSTLKFQQTASTSTTSPGSSRTDPGSNPRGAGIRPLPFRAHSRNLEKTVFWRHYVGQRTDWYASD